MCWAYCVLSLFAIRAYTVCGLVADMPSAKRLTPLGIAAVAADKPLVICVQFTPPSRLRYTPRLVAAKTVVGVAGLTTIRENRAPEKVVAPNNVHEFPPSVVLRTPLP